MGTIRVSVASRDQGDTPTVSRRVGVPTHERVLTEAFIRDASKIVKPGPGRTAFVIEEPELGAGRPDVVVVCVSVGALESFRRSGLRLSSPNSAKVIDPMVGDDGLGVTRSHARQIHRETMALGWSPQKASHYAGILADSIGIEAKMKDWRQAIRQAARFRRFFHRSAVLMPTRDISNELEKSLDFYGCGLMSLDDATLTWERRPSSRTPATWERLWLLELLLRGLDKGTAYKSTDARNPAIARR